MKAHGKDRGSVTLSVLAPVLAAVIGGAAAIGAATQIVQMAPSVKDPGPAATQLQNQQIQYGDK
jgi:hypothetical protein